jgi:hypothetical protein
MTDATRAMVRQAIRNLDARQHEDVDAWAERLSRGLSKAAEAETLNSVLFNVKQLELQHAGRV